MSETEKPTKTKVSYDQQLDAMTNGMALVDQLEVLMVEAKKQYTKAQKPNKAAGVRARKVFQRIRNTGKALRDEVNTFFKKTPN